MKTLTEEITKYDHELYTVMSNTLAHSQQDMSLREHKLLRLIISQIGIEDNDFSTYVCKMKDLAAFFHITLQAAHKDMKKLCLSLSSRVTLIESENKWETFRWIDKAVCENGVLRIKLSRELSEHLLLLRGNYLQYQLLEIIELKSVYGLRLYEILISDFNSTLSRTTNPVPFIEFSIEELRKKLCCQNKFEKTSQFKEKVIEKGIDDINNNEYAAYKISHKYVKDGKTIVAVRFFLNRR